MVERGSDKHGPRLDDDAAGNQAPAVVLERLQALPAGRTFENVQDVWRALGGAVEHRF